MRIIFLFFVCFSSFVGVSAGELYNEEISQIRIRRSLFETETRREIERYRASQQYAEALIKRIEDAKSRISKKRDPRETPPLSFEVLVTQLQQLSFFEIELRTLFSGLSTLESFAPEAELRRRIADAMIQIDDQRGRVQKLLADFENVSSQKKIATNEESLNKFKKEASQEELILVLSRGLDSVLAAVAESPVDDEWALAVLDGTDIALNDIEKYSKALSKDLFVKSYRERVSNLRSQRSTKKGASLGHPTLLFALSALAMATVSSDEPVSPPAPVEGSDETVPPAPSESQEGPNTAVTYNFTDPVYGDYSVTADFYTREFIVHKTLTFGGEGGQTGNLEIGRVEMSQESFVALLGDGNPQKVDFFSDRLLLDRMRTDSAARMSRSVEGVTNPNRAPDPEPYVRERLSSLSDLIDQVEKEHPDMTKDQERGLALFKAAVKEFQRSEAMLSKAADEISSATADLWDSLVGVSSQLLNLDSRLPLTVEDLKYYESQLQSMALEVAKVGVSMVPILGESYDLNNFISGVISGRDIWGNPVTTGEILMMEVGLLVPFLSSANFKASKNAAVQLSRELHYNKGKTIFHNPLTISKDHPPIPHDIIQTFRSGTFFEKVPQKDLKAFAFVGESGRVGRFLSIVPSSSALQASIELGINPQWGTKVGMKEVIIPAGTTIFEGIAADPGRMFRIGVEDGFMGFLSTFSVPASGVQIFVPDPSVLRVVPVQ